MKSICKYSNKTYGFTLIEILVALVIVSVGVLAIANFTVSTLGSGQVSRERLTAVHLAEQLIEEWQKTNTLPTLDTTYCKTATVWGASKVPSVAPCPTTGWVTTSNANCTPLFGVQVSYTITVRETPICGPSKAGGAAFTIFKAAVLPNPTTQYVEVSWTQRGKLHRVNLMHLSLVK